MDDNLAVKQGGILHSESLTLQTEIPSDTITTVTTKKLFKGALNSFSHKKHYCKYRELVSEMTIMPVWKAIQ